MLEDISGCPQDVYFFKADNLLMMMAAIQGQVYLLGWDGSQWSNPQLQRDLLSFEDLATFDQVIFDCRQPVQNPSGDLVVVGCDTGTGGDIWITQREIGDTTKWFPPPSAWTTPEEITTADTPIIDPILLSDSQGRLHAFWVQQEASSTTGQAIVSARDAIYYSRKDTDRWTSPVAVLQSPNGMTRQPAAAIDASDNLYVVWSGGEAGEIYFSRAQSARANSPAEWVQPMMLPSVRPAGSSPDIQVGADGSIYVAYAIPLNENRGIYLTSSADGGSTWEDPIMAFDAAQEGWEMVDQPNLAVSGGGVYNLIFGNYSLPGGTGSKGLYATRSVDGGATWSEADSITERPVSWSDLIYTINGTLHRMWVEQSSFGTIFQHEVSVDAAGTWGAPVSISAIGNSQVDPAVTPDSAGGLHLLSITEDAMQLFSLRNWRWDGARWMADENLNLGSIAKVLIPGISASVSPDEHLSVTISGTTMDPPLGIPGNWLSASGREVDILDILPTPVVEPAIRLTVIAPDEVAPIPSATPTVGLPTLPSDPGSGQPTSGNAWFGLTIAAVLAAVIAVLVFTIRLIGMKK
jgi:hypothetical protein